MASGSVQSINSSPICIISKPCPNISWQFNGTLRQSVNFSYAMSSIPGITGPEIPFLKCPETGESVNVKFRGVEAFKLEWGMWVTTSIGSESHFRESILGSSSQMVEQQHYENTQSFFNAVSRTSACHQSCYLWQQQSVIMKNRTEAFESERQSH